MAAVAATGIGAVSLGAANLPQPVSAATNDVQASSIQADLKTAQENVKTAEAGNTQAQQSRLQLQLSSRKLVKRTLSQASWQAFFLCWPEFLSLASALRKVSPDLVKISL